MTTLPEPADEPTPAPDAVPAPDPAVAALYAPPYVPGVVQLALVVHVDPDGLWAEVPTLPGLFATGTTIPELGTSLGEAVLAYLTENTRVVPADGTDEVGEPQP